MKNINKKVQLKTLPHKKKLNNLKNLLPHRLSNKSKKQNKRKLKKEVKKNKQTIKTTKKRDTLITTGVAEKMEVERISIPAGEKVKTKMENKENSEMTDLITRRSINKKIPNPQSKTTKILVLLKKLQKPGNSRENK